MRKTYVRGFNSVAKSWTDSAVVKLQTNDLITRSMMMMMMMMMMMTTMRRKRIKSFQKEFSFFNIKFLHTLFFVKFYFRFLEGMGWNL